MTQYSSKVALLSQSIDFAGMFPPASLDLDSTLRRAATFRKDSKNPWLMNRVVLALEEVKKLNPSKLFSLGADGSPWLLSVLGNPSPGDSSEDFVKSVAWDFREMRRVHDRYFHSSCKIEQVGYEIRLPNPVYSPGEGILSGEYIFPALEQIESFWPRHMDIYFEVSLEGAWEDTVEGVSRVIAEWLNENSDSSVIPGLKVRTGGKFTPRAEQLALVINECATHGIKFKATQGLHHPLSKGPSFGFINLLAAINFAFSLGQDQFSLAHIQECLVSDQQKDFVFGTNDFSWKKHVLTNDEIESARRTHAAAFGSCSLDEPDQDLSKEFP